MVLYFSLVQNPFSNLFIDCDVQISFYCLNSHTLFSLVPDEIQTHNLWIDQRHLLNYKKVAATSLIFIVALRYCCCSKILLKNKVLSCVLDAKYNLNNFPTISKKTIYLNPLVETIQPKKLLLRQKARCHC